MASANRERTVLTETPSCRAIISSETPWPASRSTCIAPSPRCVHGSGAARAHSSSKNERSAATTTAALTRWKL
jgi:hypothetical protein